MIEELHRFILIANEGNLTKVAEKIFITQSALTQSIHRLEKEIGAKLFTQKGKYLELSTDGKAILPIALKILELWKKAKTPQIRSILKPTLTIGMYDNAALRLAKFVQRNTPSEHYSLEFIIDKSASLLRNLRLGTIDIAITVINKNHTTPKDTICLAAFVEELLPVSNKQFNNTPLSQIPFILYNQHSFTRDYIDEIFILNKLKPTIYAESTSTTFMKQLAILGCGVALLPANFIKQELLTKTLKKQHLPLKFTRQFGIFIQKDNQLAYKNLIREITKILQSAP